MAIQPDEKILIKDDAKSDYFGKGVLTMTNTRVIFEARTGGLLSKTTEVRVDKPLGSIKEVTAPSGKELRIQFEGSVEPTTFHVANAEKWATAIKSALAVGGTT